jgi:hypothetical protein
MKVLDHRNPGLNAKSRFSKNFATMLAEVRETLISHRIGPGTSFFRWILHSLALRRVISTRNRGFHVDFDILKSAASKPQKVRCGLGALILGPRGSFCLWIMYILIVCNVLNTGNVYFGVDLTS